MTQNSTERWKVILPVSIAAILLVAVAGFNLFDSNAQAAVPVGGPIECLEVLHFDKIIFKNKEDLFKRSDGTLAVEEGSIMDIKVPDNPAAIEFPLKKAVDRSNIPWTTEDGEDITLKDLELIDVEYAIVCVGFLAT